MNKFYYPTQSDPFENIYSTTEKVGLPNIGNSCFINSVLQIFLHDDELFGALIAQFGREDLLTQLQSLYSSFAGIKVGEQCDAVLFLNFLLDSIEEGIKDKEWVQDSWKQKWISRTKCMHCNNKLQSQQHENMWFFYPTGTEEPFVAMEEVCKTQSTITVDEYKCDKCEMRGAQRKYSISNSPSNIFMNLQHFQQQKVIVYEDIDLKISKANVYDYSLKGFFMHKGTQNFGHYVAYIHDSNGWYCYNDEKITKCSTPIEEVLLQNRVPLLWYSKQTSQHVSDNETESE
jgi:ubiquitin C-terminal hydrolase